MEPWFDCYNSNIKSEPNRIARLCVVDRRFATEDKASCNWPVEGCAGLMTRWARGPGRSTLGPEAHSPGCLGLCEPQREGRPFNLEIHKCPWATTVIMVRTLVLNKAEEIYFEAATSRSNFFLGDDCLKRNILKVAGIIF